MNFFAGLKLRGSKTWRQLDGIQKLWNYSYIPLIQNSRKEHITKIAIDDFHFRKFHKFENAFFLFQFALFLNLYRYSKNQ